MERGSIGLRCAERGEVGDQAAVGVRLRGGVELLLMIMPSTGGMISIARGYFYFAIFQHSRMLGSYVQIQVICVDTAMPFSGTFPYSLGSTSSMPPYCLSSFSTGAIRLMDISPYP